MDKGEKAPRLVGGVTSMGVDLALGLVIRAFTVMRRAGWGYLGGGVDGVGLWVGFVMLWLRVGWRRRRGGGGLVLWMGFRALG